MKRRSLFSKFFFLVLFLIVLTATTTGLGVGLITYRAFLTNLQADYRLVSAQACRRIDLLLENTRRDVMAAAAILTGLRLDDWRMRTVLVELGYAQRLEFNLVRLGGPRVVEIGRFQDFYLDEVRSVIETAGQGQFAISSPVSQAGLPFVYMAAPVRDEGLTKAVVLGRLDITPIWSMLVQIKRDLNLGPQGRVWLLDQTGALIASDELSETPELDRNSLPTSGSSPINIQQTTLDQSQFLTLDDGRMLLSLFQDQKQAIFRLEDLKEQKTILAGGNLSCVPWVLVLAQPYNQAFRSFKQGWWFSISLVLGVILIGASSTWFMVKQVLTPIAHLKQGVARAAHGDFSKPIAIESQDEVGELASSFNEMQSALQVYFQRLVVATTELNHAKHLAVLGTTASKINHQIGNFLHKLTISLKILKKENLSEASRQTLEIIHENTMQINEFIQRLLGMARRAEIELCPWLPEIELGRIIEGQKRLSENQGVTIEAFLKTTAPVLADRYLMEQAVTNLLVNAIEASKPGDRIAVQVMQEDGRVKIEVADHGCGMASEDLAKIFTPFFTTKRSKGTGLGLSLAQVIIHSHGGEISLGSRLGEGTTATMYLPVAPDMFQATRVASN